MLILFIEKKFIKVFIKKLVFLKNIFKNFFLELKIKEKTNKLLFLLFIINIIFFLNVILLLIIIKKKINKIKYIFSFKKIIINFNKLFNIIVKNLYCIFSIFMNLLFYTIKISFLCFIKLILLFFLLLNFFFKKNNKLNFLFNLIILFEQKIKKLFFLFFNIKNI